VYRAFLRRKVGPPRLRLAQLRFRQNAIERAQGSFASTAAMRPSRAFNGSLTAAMTVSATEARTRWAITSGRPTNCRSNSEANLELIQRRQLRLPSLQHCRLPLNRPRIGLQPLEQRFAHAGLAGRRFVTGFLRSALPRGGCFGSIV
jgi:hypothetical protein